MTGHRREAQRGTGATHTFQQITTMRVGVNYPWRDYGWDFGVSPLSWISSAPWQEQIDADLERFRTLGVSVVRWFILCDGLAYGTPVDGSPYATPRKDLTRPDKQWRFDPPDPGTSSLDEIVNDVGTLLARFSANQTPSRRRPRGIKLLPVLIDHKMFYPCPLAAPVFRTTDGFVKGGRSDVVRDSRKRELFVNGLVRPLLERMAPFRDIIEAVEIVNEPEWCVHEFSGGNAAAKTLQLSEMRAFLQQIADVIISAGFRPTVGFSDDLSSRAWGVRGLLPQVHYYGQRTDRNVAAPLPQPTSTEACLGEFGTGNASNCTTLTCDPIWTGASVLDRLWMCADAQYASAFVWSKYANDGYVWNEEVEDAIRLFKIGRRAPPP